MNLQAQIDILNSAEGVLEAWLKEPVSLGTTLRSVTAIWIYASGDIVRKDSGDLIVSDFGGKDEEAKWLGKIPSVLAVPVEPDHGPLGDDDVLLSLLPVKVVKPEIERGNNEARVAGYEVVDGKALPVVFLLYTDGVEVKVVRGDASATTGLEAVK